MPLEGMTAEVSIKHPFPMAVNAVGEGVVISQASTKSSKHPSSSTNRCRLPVE
tara:strand:- start:6990 stop:7148 length:159 start_codon:yes stop_codon:yes gene_type:complete